jgi:hypothetical protein
VSPNYVSQFCLRLWIVELLSRYGKKLKAFETIDSLCFVLIIERFFFLSGILQPMRVWASSFLRFHDQTQWRTTVGRTPLDEWSARRRDLYLTTHTTLTTDIHAPGGMWTRDPSRRPSADPRLRPLGHWDRLILEHSSLLYMFCTVHCSIIANENQQNSRTVYIFSICST